MSRPERANRTRGGFRGEAGGLRQIRILTAVSLRGLFGWNEFLHTKNPKKRRQGILMLVLWVFLAALLEFYVGLLSHGLVQAGMAEMILPLLYLAASFVILFFSVLKAGEMMFQMRTYEMLISLPVRKSAIVISRFLVMYLTNFVISLLVLVPGLAVYAYAKRPGVTFYLFGLLGAAVLPLLPLALASVLGAGVAALSARMRHRSLVASALTFLLVIGVMAGSAMLGTLDEEELLGLLLDFAVLASVWIGRLYPPAGWFGESVLQADVYRFLLLTGVSLAAFLAVSMLISHWFVQISSALCAVTSRNNYRMERLKRSSVRRALYVRERKRYFASSIYVTNTAACSLLMLLFAGALLFFGDGQLSMLLELDRTGRLNRMVPLLLALFGTMMPTTACAVSMEGRQWWILRTLPVSAREIFDAKILVNLTVACPFYLISEFCMLAALRPDPLGALWLVLLPAVYILFASVAGISVNLCFPVFDWDTEARVVKQSAAVTVWMVVALAAVGLPAVGLLALRRIPADVLLCLLTIVLGMVTALLYRKNGKRDLRQIG